MSVDDFVGALAKLAARGGDRRLAGHFANVIDVGGVKVAIGTDGVGTKLLLGTCPEHFTGLAVDCAAMNANDLICVGARPLAMVDYIAIEDVEGAVQYAEAIAHGFATAEDLGAGSVVGGEVAVLPGIIERRHDGVPGMDIAATAIGVVEDEILDGSAVTAGDIVIGYASSGLHSNGFTRMRRLVDDLGLDLDADPPFEPSSSSGVTLRDELLVPTVLYPRLMESLTGLRVRAAANITGGGLSNIARVLPNTGLALSSWPTNVPLWDWVRAHLPPAEAFATFNMGVGFVVVVDRQDAEAVLDRTGSFRPKVLGEASDHVGPGVVELRPFELRATRHGVESI